jgi:hypothetical protein
VPGCTYDKLQGGAATTCKPTACSAGDVQICSSDKDCPAANPTCTPFEWKVLQLGYCK